MGSVSHDSVRSWCMVSLTIAVCGMSSTMSCSPSSWGSCRYTGNARRPYFRNRRYPRMVNPYEYVARVWCSGSCWVCLTRWQEKNTGYIHTYTHSQTYLFNTSSQTSMRGESVTSYTDIWPTFHTRSFETWRVNLASSQSKNCHAHLDSFPPTRW